MSAVLREQVIDYPESDGQPMADTDQTREEMTSAIGTLMHHFSQAPDVYVTGNTLIYYEEGNPEARFSPDVFVVRGVPKHMRRTYRLWEERRPPSFVMEIVSRRTWMEDEGNKKVLCAHLKVGEYFLYDPEGAYIEPTLQGFRLERRLYCPIPPGPDGSILSSALGLSLSLENGLLYFSDPTTGKRLLRMPDVYAAYEQAELARQQAEARASAAEAEVARLRALLAGGK